MTRVRSLCIVHPYCSAIPPIPRKKTNSYKYILIILWKTVSRNETSCKLGRNASDQPIVRTLKCYSREYNSSARGVRHHGRSSLLRFGHFCSPCTPSCFLPTTLRFDHDRKIPTSGRAGRCSLLAQCGHRWPESRQGTLEHHTSQGCFRFCQHPSHHDPGEFPPPSTTEICQVHTLPGHDGQ